ncbi:MAG: hypothetical protein H6818_02880 [Phycisphaerales bacterium]|nr:hypothetical protein [Phycisphaerales bacterium]MCB9864675.1 hypothetical protein [Phycisphaerales bacterium]
MFFELLDPRIDRRPLLGSPGEEQAEARRVFPELVASSNLRYWRPGDDLQFKGRRLLLGLGATYSLYDLRFADVLNAELGEGCPGVRIDVFDCGDLNDHDFMDYFPVEVQLACTPILGIWEEGSFRRFEQGYRARELALELIGSSHTAAEVGEFVTRIRNDLSERRIDRSD